MAFPSLAGAPCDLEALDAWFDAGGCTEQASHAAAFVLQKCGVPGIEFEASEALHVWDGAHKAAYAQLCGRLGTRVEVPAAQ